MSLSVIINTCAGGDPATPNSQGVLKHALRAYALQNWIIPRYTADPAVSEVIVVGEWHAGDDYTYLPCPSVYKNCTDALAQRHKAAQIATGEWLVFQHDDHVFDPTWTLHLDSRCDVLAPSRWTRLRSPNGERLNNGEPEFGNPGQGYVSGHGSIYRRAVIEAVPWNSIGLVHTWDMQHTWFMRDAGFRVEHHTPLKLWDVEAGSQPWT